MAAGMMLGACAGGVPFLDTPPSDVAQGNVGIAAPDEADPDYDRPAPVVKMPQLGAKQQTRNENGQAAMIDVSNVSQGYVGASAKAGERVRFRVSKDGVNDDYELDGDGTPSYYPLTRGDGGYAFTVFIYLRESDNGPLYNPFLTAEASAQIADERAPYTIPTRLARYGPDSLCVQESFKATAHSSTDLEVAGQVVAWMANYVTYDYDKAVEIGGKRVEYEPYPDDIYASRKGICYDYASLATAMLRANGIPTKLVKGQVTTPEGETIYHAWNLCWIDEEGWVVVNLPTNPGDWSRVDTTFLASAGSSIAEFIGNGQNYVPISEH
jgi:hypothetical protein